jgi:hypothetical protein
MAWLADHRQQIIARWTQRPDLLVNAAATKLVNSWSTKLVNNLAATVFVARQSARP